MKQLKHYIKQYSTEFTEQSIDPKKMCTTIERSKEAFLKLESEKVLSYKEFLYQQSQYIHKRWWILQAVILMLSGYIINHSGSNGYIQRILGLTAPLFVLLIVPELWKNRSYGAVELECTTFYSLRQIYAARLVLFGIVDMLLLSVFFVGIRLNGQMGIVNIMIDFFIPFNVTCCICFGSLCSFKVDSQYFTLILGGCWIAVWLLVILNELIYEAIVWPVWIGLFLGSIVYIGYCIKKTWFNCEQIGEVNGIWH